MKKYISILIGLIVSLNFISCTDDDDFSSSNLIGTWSLASYEGWYADESSNWEKVPDDPDEYEPGSMVFRFYGDGEMELKADDETTYWEWEFKSNKLVLFTVYEGTVIFNILNLTSDELVVDTHNKVDGDYEGYQKFTFKKVN